MAKPHWHHMVLESQRNALRAMDEWNCSRGSYADFVAYMHRAWHYLLHSEFHRDKIDYHYRDVKTGKHVMIDGEPKAWDLESCVKCRFKATNDPVRRNIELFIALRNKAEHRYEHGLKAATGGRAQALVINYEVEMSTEFGPQYSLADRLRFPVFVTSITSGLDDELRTAARKLPRKTRDIVARYEADLGQETLDDLRYDYRIRLVPMLGPKTDADLAVNFVRLDELTDDERRVMLEAGRTSTVIVRDRPVEVAAKDKLLPKQVAHLVEQQLSFYFGTNMHAEVWKKLQVRPAENSPNPTRTESRYCVYNEPFRNYLYTSAWVQRVVKEIGTVEKYREFFGRDPHMKPSDISRKVAS